MKTIAITITTALALTGCSALAPSSQRYCLEEQERNNYDYMVVTDPSVCETQTDDVEWFTGDVYLNNGDVAYVEYDGLHSKNKEKKKTEIKTVPNVPAYTPPPAPRFTVPPKPVNQAPAQQPKVNAPANNAPRVQSGNSGSTSRGSSNAGSVSSGRK